MIPKYKVGDNIRSNDKSVNWLITEIIDNTYYKVKYLNKNNRGFSDKYFIKSIDTHDFLYSINNKYTEEL